MIYAFGDFELDATRYRLGHAGRPVKLEPKVFDVLAYLVRHRERVVARSELFQQLWSGETVSESALTYCIKAARRALHDDGAEQRIIQTQHRRGYRFIAVVTEAAPHREPEGDRPPSATPAPQSLFIGRERELAQLSQALQNALAARGQLMLLVGEPGIGKTRTAEELVARAREHGAEVLVGRCYEGDGAPAFWPWVQIVRGYLRDRDSTAIAAVMGGSASDIAQFAPEVREHLPNLVVPPPLEPEQARFRLFDSTTHFLLSAASQRPLVLVLDDLHWADKPSLLLLQFLAREIRDARILVVGTYRDMEWGRQHPLAHALGDLARVDYCQRIPLRGLTQQDVALFMADSAGTNPPDALVEAVHRETDGNPFFVTEIVRLLASTNSTAAGGATKWRLAVPQTVREAIGRRLNQLSSGCHETLRVASVLGREFDVAALRHIHEHQTAEVDTAVVLARLDEAAGVRMIEALPAPGRYRFVHALIRDTLYEGLTAAESATLHRLSARAIEDLHRIHLEPQLAQLAHHYLHAGPGESTDRALAYAERAAEYASTQLAYEAAAAHYEGALQLIEATGGSRQTHCDVLLALGETQWRAGEMTNARETFRRAASSARGRDSAEQFARAALGFGDWFRGFEVGVVDPDLLAFLDEALLRLGDEESALRARVLARLAVALLHEPESFARRDALSRQAVEIAERLADPAAQLAAHYSRHWAIWGPDSLADRLHTAAEMVRLATLRRDQEMAFHAHRFHFMDLMEAGTIDAAEVEVAACARLAGELRQPYYHWYVETFRALRAFDGRFEDCERLTFAAAAVGQRAQNQNVSQIFGIQMFALRREQGRLAELEGPTRGFVSTFPTIPGWRVALAIICAEIGRTEEARDEFERLAANDFAALPRDTFWLAGIAGLADVCAYLGDAARAAVLFNLLEPYADRTVMMSPGAACSGSAARPLAQLAATMGHGPDARAHFELALASEQRLGATSLMAHTQRQYAALLFADGSSVERAKAQRLLDSAAMTYERLGMTSYFERVRAVPREGQQRSPSVITLSARRAAPRLLRRGGSSGR